MVGHLTTNDSRRSRTGIDAPVIRAHSRDEVDKSSETTVKDLMWEIVLVTTNSFIHEGFMDNNVDEVEEKINFQTATRSIIV